MKNISYTTIDYNSVYERTTNSGKDVRKVIRFFAGFAYPNQELRDEKKLEENNLQKYFENLKQKNEIRTLNIVSALPIQK